MFRRKKSKIKTKAAILLENGDIFYGEGVGIKGIKLGELCFNTAMTGYQEAITDPSYASQILLFTFPHIGITGTNLVDIESKRIFLSGVIFKSLSIDYSNWRGSLDIDAWLVKNKVIGINKINTRDLTITLRESGALKGAILNGIDESFNPEKIIKKIKKYNPQGIFLSNGPGDPFATFAKVSETIAEIIKRGIPLFGICLGHQIIGLSLKAQTIKMHHGHHGVNQPVKNLTKNTIEITSQNHGFMINKNNLPSCLKITHLSLFDQVIQGLKHKNKPIFSVQYHPESSPGPHDSRYLFRQYRELITKSSKYAKKKRY